MVENQVIVYQKEGKITINSGNFEMAGVKVFDIRGRLITSQQHINASETSIIDAIVNQVLIIEITTVDGIRITRKIVN